MGTPVTISRYGGIAVYESNSGMPVEVSGNGSGMVVHYVYDGTIPGNAKRGGDATPVKTLGGFPGQTLKPDGTSYPANWTP